MKASFLDLRKRSEDIIRALELNQSVTLFYRGKKKGVILPASQMTGGLISVRRHPAFGVWKDRPGTKDVRGALSKFRKARHA